MVRKSLGSYLKQGRLKADLSVEEAAARLGFRYPLNILRWERNEISTLKLATLRKMIRLYKLDAEVVFDLLLQLRLRRIEDKLKQLKLKKKL